MQPLSDAAPSKEQLRLLNGTIKKVTTETEEMRFNTAIAAMMEFINGVYKWDDRCGWFGVVLLLHGTYLAGTSDYSIMTCVC